MNHLFSPWRSAYIETFSNNKKKETCLFCGLKKTSALDKKNLVIWRGKYCFVVMNKFPYNSGHIMIIPYKHTSTLENLTNEVHAEVMQTTARCMKIMRTTHKPHGFNFGANFGRTAGAGIDKHLHFHLVPRWEGDTNFMPVLNDTKVVSEALQNTWKVLQKRFKEIQ